MEEKDRKDEQEFHYVKETVVDKAKLRKLKFKRTLRVFVVFGAAFLLLLACLELLERSRSVEEKGRLSAQDRDSIEIIVDNRLNMGSMSVKEYMSVSRNMVQAGNSTSGYMVTIFAVGGSKDGEITSGIITGIGENIYVLTDNQILNKGKSLMVKFIKGESVKGALVKEDSNSGIAIIKVPADEISKDTLRQIEEAPVETETLPEPDSPVILMGNPYAATARYMTFGTLTSSDSTRTVTDGAYRLLSTDIGIDAKQNGFLVNMQGNVIGMVLGISSGVEEGGRFQAVAISDITTAVSRLSQGKSMPYLGIEGQEINDEVISQAQQDMPEGVYIKNVELGSPAYSAGLVSGDIIVRMEEKNVKNPCDYKRILESKHAGDKISITVKRNGLGGYYEYNYTVVPGERD